MGVQKAVEAEEIEVTPEMIEAGLHYYSSLLMPELSNEDRRELVADIYRTMQHAWRVRHHP